MASTQGPQERRQTPEITAASRQDRLRAKKSRRTGDGSINTSHKARSLWFQDIAAWPYREAPVDALVRERRRVRRSLAVHAAATAWQLAGPTNVGGRMTCVVAHPSNADIIWAGAAGGGLWHSADAGQTWTPKWHRQQSLNIGALTMDPNHPDVLYCGTGEANLSADSYPGVGVYKTETGGKSWKLIASCKQTGLPSRIGAIAVDPFDSDHLLVGGVGHRFPGQRGPSGFGGLYQSKDGGRTWRRLRFISSNEYRCHAVVFHVAEKNIVYATIAEQGSKNGIWRSDDGGKTWAHLTRGLPSSERFDRTSLAMALSKPSILYAIAATADGQVLGVFRTTDGGDSWKHIHGGAFHYRRRIDAYFDELERQMTYNNTIAVHPTDADHVICGGVDLHLSTDGGKTWRNVTQWDKPIGSPNYAHADQHALVMPAAKPGRVYAMNDGGMDVSEDGGHTWSNRSNGLAVSMFYDLDVAQTDPNFFGGGLQDNGSQVTTDGKPDTFFDITGGDGGWLEIDPHNANHFYCSIYNMNVFRFPRSDGRPGMDDVSPPELDSIRETIWMCYIAMDASNPKVVFTGSNRVWRTRNDGKSWKAVSPFFRGVITAIEIAAADPRRIYVGTSFGTIHRSADGGETWSENLASAALPGVRITRLRTSPADARHVFATVGHFGNSHVFRSLDGCVTWEDIDQGKLPDVPHHSIAIPNDRPNELFVSSDVGVFLSLDSGNAWKDLTGDLPNVSVVDLVYHNGTETLSAATYGRSIWRIQMR